MRTAFLSVSFVMLAAFTSTVRADEVSIGTIQKGKGSLQSQLRREAEVARKKSLRPFVELTAVWCKPCQAVTKYLSDPLMVAAFTGVHLLRVEVDDWDADELTKAGIAAGGVPTFFELGANAKPTARTITSSVWADDIPKNMAPPLRAFFNPKK
jgi:thiol:disulfide interchange protein